MSYKKGCFKQGQKLRVIVNGVSVYTTAKQIRMQFGDFTAINNAVTGAMNYLEDLRQDEPEMAGLCGRWDGVDVQINTL